MKIKILGSSSSGNSFLLKANDGEVLIIECGIDFKEVKKALDFDISNVVGCLISHEHGDHSKYVNKVLDAGINCYLSSGTKQALSLDRHRANILGQFQKISIGKYKVMAFNTKHDSAEPVGFLIQHEELGLMLFATDSYYVEYTFSGLNHIFVECNYAKDILQENVKNGRINKALKDRTLKSHFELDNVKSFLKANDLTTVHNICLLHLSDNNSDAERFKREIEDLTGIKTTIADKGTEIELDLVPF